MNAGLGHGLGHGSLEEKYMTELERKESRSIFSAIKTWLWQIEGKAAFKTALAASLSFILGIAFSTAFDRPNMIASGLWSVLASIVVIQAYLGGTYQAAWQRFFGVLIGSLIGAASIVYMGDSALSLGVGVFCTIIVCSLLYLKESLRIASMSTAAIIILSGIRPEVDPWLFSLYRFLDSCLGIIVAIFIAYFVWPERAVENLRRNCARILSLVAKYYRLAVSMDVKESSHQQTEEALYDEILTLLQKNREYRHDAALELFNREEKREQWTLMANQLEQAFDSVAALSRLHKDILSKIFDDSLANTTAELIDQTDLALQNLARTLARELSSVDLHPLENALTRLSQELLRFRETRTTRKFNIEDVESFFVFFYRLRCIGEDIQKMNAYISAL